MFTFCVSDLYPNQLVPHVICSPVVALFRISWLFCLKLSLANILRVRLPPFGFWELGTLPQCLNCLKKEK